MQKLSKHQTFMFDFLARYPKDWHSIARNQATIRIARALARKGYIDFDEEIYMARAKVGPVA